MAQSRVSELRGSEENIPKSTSKQDQGRMTWLLVLEGEEIRMNSDNNKELVKNWERNVSRLHIVVLLI